MPERLLSVISDGQALDLSCGDFRAESSLAFWADNFCVVGARSLSAGHTCMKVYGYTRCAVTMFGLGCVLHFTLEFVSK